MKRFISVIIAVALILTTFGVSSVLAVSDNAVIQAQKKPVAGRSVGDVVYFGSYPQAKVSDNSLINELNKIEKDWQSYEYCSNAINSGEGTITISNYMNYCDVEYAGEKYRAVFFTDYRPSTTSDETSAGKSRQDENGYNPNTVYYFQFQPLKWKVLDPAQGYLICVDVIDSQPFNNFIVNIGGNYYGDPNGIHYATDWEFSTLRAWLNVHFYNTAFNDSEKASIGLTHLKNNTTYPNSAYDYNMTYDKIFIPSYDDVRTPAYGFKNNILWPDSNRRAKGTDYAKCQGLNVAWSLFSFFRNPTWRLRTNDGSATIYNVNKYGMIRSFYQVNNTSYGIRPALKFAPGEVIDKVTFNPCGGTVKETSRELTAGSALTALPKAEREGYNFEGWYSAQEGGYRIQEGHIIDRDVTLYAHWSTYPVNFRLDEQPTKIHYYVGEEFDITGADMKLEYANGTYRTLSSSEVTINGFDSSVIGNQEVYLSYTEGNSVFESAKFTVSVGQPNLVVLDIEDQVRISNATGLLENGTITLTVNDASVPVCIYPTTRSNKTVTFSELDGASVSKFGTCYATANATCKISIEESVYDVIFVFDN